MTGDVPLEFGSLDDLLSLSISKLFTSSERNRNNGLIFDIEVNLVLRI